MDDVALSRLSIRRDDRILRATRLLAALVLPFLVVAFGVLYLSPDDSGRLFAWEVHPRIQAMFAAAGYIGGAFFFANVSVGRRWHRVGAGFLPVATFATSMLLLTILHWDRFDLGHFPFQVWLAIYLVTPGLVVWAWLHNRGADSGQPEEDDVNVPLIIRRGLALFGLTVLAAALGGFIWPSLLVPLWPWPLTTPLAARQIAGWLSLLGVGGIVIGRDARWSAWRVGMGSIGLWHVLVLLAAMLNPGDFTSFVNWYLVVVAVMLAGMAVLYRVMEARRYRQRS
jgi:hypothetical protein